MKRQDCDIPIISMFQLYIARRLTLKFNFDHDLLCLTLGNFVSS